MPYMSYFFIYLVASMYTTCFVYLRIHRSDLSDARLAKGLLVGSVWPLYLPFTIVSILIRKIYYKCKEV